jgi:polygalacturonase
MWLNVSFYATRRFGFAIAIFNVRGTCYAGGMSPSNLGSANAAALQAAVNAAQAAGGGAIHIPAISVYQINGTTINASALTAGIFGEPGATGAWLR